MSVGRGFTFDGITAGPDSLYKGLAALEGVHSIEILLFIPENDGCRRTDIYDRFSRSTSIQSRMDTLIDSGLVRSERIHGTRGNGLHLTETGIELATFLQDFNIRHGCREREHGGSPDGRTPSYDAMHLDHSGLEHDYDRSVPSLERDRSP